MATLTVLEFDTAEGAERMVQALKELQMQRLIIIEDAAIVTWPQGAKKPQTRQLRDLVRSGTLGGAFWGLFFGLLFFVPLLGVAVGTAVGALSGVLRDVGVDDNLIKRVRAEVIEGTSALFLLTTRTMPDQLAEEVRARDLRFTLLASNLSQAQEAKLKEIFGAE